MIEKNKLCIIIPMKHCSQRVPGKNYRDFNGLPLFDVIINKIIQVDYIDKIIIDTNSEYIKNLINAKKIDKIQVYDRPEELCAHEISTNLLLMNVIEKLELNYDYYLMTHVTNPLITIETIKDMIEVFLRDKNKEYDSLFSVKKLQTRLYKFEKERVNALNHNINELIQTQDLEPLYEENSCFYIFNKETIFKKKHRIGYNPYMYVMDDIESFDIDTESDFLIAKTLDFNFKLKENNKKYVLITGANGGIGKELCKKFKTMNWNVYGVDINDNTDNTYIDEFINLDLTEKGSINQIIESIKNNGNRLDCIVNNAALQICKPSWELSEEDWDNTYACNVKTPFLLINKLLPFLKNNKGNVINIGSVHSINTSDEISAYASSKSALVGLTKNLAIELSKFNIRVNSISPGAINTGMLRSGLGRNNKNNLSEEELINRLGSKHLLGKIGDPYNVADFVYYIIQNEFINGSNLIMDGGASIKLSTE